MSNELTLTGLDGSNPLGFMAALGVLEVVGQEEAVPPPTLRWEYSNGWNPVVTGVSTLEQLADAVLRDAKCQWIDQVLGFRYLKLEKNGPKETGALAPQQAVLRAWLEVVVEQGDFKTAQFASGLMCETATEALDPKKLVEGQVLVEGQIPFNPDFPLDQVVLQTPFDFTSRNTQFLDQARRIRDVLTLEIIATELGCGIGAPSERIMRWDPLTETPGALFAGLRIEPHPVAEWLAFRGLPLFMLVGSHSKVQMPGFVGRRKAGSLHWGLWNGPLGRDMVRTFLTTQILTAEAKEREARGVVAAFRVGLVKDATGYEGTFSPTEPLTT